MFDDVTRRRAFWLKLSTLPIKVICFSKKLHDFISNLGVSSLSVQYYLNPMLYKQTTDYKTRRVFFWLRGNIGFDTISLILGDNKIDSMDVRWEPDPNANVTEPDETFIRKYNVNITRGFLKREEYLALVSRNNLFIAPRLKEGIGISTLEALAMRQCVIAHDDSTMNEYICDGKNGFLFDAQNPRQIDLSNFETLAQQSHKSCVQGCERWQNDIQRILEFVQAPRIQRRPDTVLLKLYIIWVTFIDIIGKWVIRSFRALKTIKQIVSSQE